MGGDTQPPISNPLHIYFKRVNTIFPSVRLLWRLYLRCRSLLDYPPMPSRSDYLKAHGRVGKAVGNVRRVTFSSMVNCNLQDLTLPFSRNIRHTDNPRRLNNLLNDPISARSFLCRSFRINTITWFRIDDSAPLVDHLLPLSCPNCLRSTVIGRNVTQPYLHFLPQAPHEEYPFPDFKDPPPFAPSPGAHKKDTGTHGWHQVSGNTALSVRSIPTSLFRTSPLLVHDDGPRGVGRVTSPLARFLEAFSVLTTALASCS